MERIASALRDARVSAGLSQRQLADLLGIGTSYLSDIENARRHFPERLIPTLPPEVRGPVAEAMAAEHDAASARLRQSVA